MGLVFDFVRYFLLLNVLFCFCLVFIFKSYIASILRSKLDLQSSCNADRNASSNVQGVVKNKFS